MSIELNEENSRRAIWNIESNDTWKSTIHKVTVISLSATKTLRTYYHDFIVHHYFLLLNSITLKSREIRQKMINEFNLYKIFIFRNKFAKSNFCKIILYQIRIYFSRNYKRKRSIQIEMAKLVTFILFIL